MNVKNEAFKWLISGTFKMQILHGIENIWKSYGKFFFEIFSFLWLTVQNEKKNSFILEINK